MHGSDRYRTGQALDQLAQLVQARALAEQAITEAVDELAGDARAGGSDRVRGVLVERMQVSVPVLSR